MDIDNQRSGPQKPMPDNVQEKWGEAAKGGYQAVPHALFRFQKELGLSSSELVTLLNILDFWWQAERRPCPGAAALAKRMDIDARSVQRHLKKLAAMGYAIREREGDNVRRYNLDGLVFRLSALVREEGRGVARKVLKPAVEARDKKPAEKRVF